MEVILISQRRGPHAPRRYGTLAVAGAAAVMALVLGAAAHVGYTMGLAVSEPAAAPDRDGALRGELHAQSLEVEEAIRSAEENVNALSLRLGEMQARMIRLDALGERLVEMGQLDQAEFAFDSPPALGGPSNPSTLESQSVLDFVASLEALAAEIADREPKLSALESLLMNQKLQADVHPAGRPLTRGWISSTYGPRADPVTGKKAYHSGLDFAGSPGSPVVAVASGVVIEASYHSGLGNLVEINHGNGYVTRYAHNKQNLVAVGDTVKKGQPIAVLGSSGRSTGPHVHFEVLQDGQTVDPIEYVRANH